MYQDFSYECVPSNLLSHFSTKHMGSAQPNKIADRAKIILKNLQRASPELVAQFQNNSTQMFLKQGSHMLEKYLNLEGFLEKSLNTKFAIYNVNESIGPRQDQSRHPWICSQIRICSHTRYPQR